LRACGSAHSETGAVRLPHLDPLLDGLDGPEEVAENVVADGPFGAALRGTNAPTETAGNLPLHGGPDELLPAASARRAIPPV